MAVYRFRVVFEDDEDVYREIDLLGKQTYEDFHKAIQEAISFDSSKEASFFMSDDYWKKGQELALNPPPQEDDDDDYPSARKKMEIRPMSKAKIAEYIDDPHQKMVYVFDPKVKWTFRIELSKILSDDPKTNYPKCTKSVGVAPKQYKVAVVPPPLDEDEEEDDAEDKKAKEKIFTADEGIDADEHLGDSEEGEEPSADSDDQEQGSDESSEDEGGDFGAEAFGDGDSEEF